MSNFWDDGKEVIGKIEEIEIEGGGGGLMPIPDGTQVRIGIAEAKWETNEREGTFISLKHQVTAPACYKGRIIFQKLHVNPVEGTANVSLSDDERAKKRSKALKMLAVIDTNAGGKLLSSPEKPTDVKLQSCLVGKTMMMKLGVFVFETKDGVKIQNPIDYFRGNWVQKVAPKDRFVEMTKEEQEAAVAKTQAEYNEMLAAGPSQREAAPQRQQQQRPAQQQQTPGAGLSPDFDSFDDDIPF
jgi:hypothetical protein